MKKLICTLLALTMLLTLFGCSKQTETGPELREPVAETEEGIFDLAAFDYTQYGYLQSELSLPEEVSNPNWFCMRDDTISFRDQTWDDETGQRTYTVYSAAYGQDFAPVVQLVTEKDCGFEKMVYDGSYLWGVYYQNAAPDEDVFENLYSLKKLNTSGQMLAEFDLSGHFENAENFFVSDILPAADGGLYLSVCIFGEVEVQGSLMHFDQDAQLAWSHDDFDDNPVMALTGDGELVCFHKGNLCTAGQEGFTPVGLELEQEYYWWSMTSGSGGYDLFLYDDVTLYAADLEAGTLVPLVDWMDWGISNVNFLGALSDSRLLVNSFSFIDQADRYVLMDRTAISDMPVKTTLTAACVYYADDSLTSAATVFNTENDLYNVEVVVYDDPTQLDMAIANGEIPDILVLDENQSKYIQKGLLADMLELMDEYGGITGEDIVPSLLEACMTGDSLYMLPLYFHVRTIAGLPKYVGTDQGWSLEQFIQALENKPEGMYACDFGGSTFLSFIMGGLYTNYVDTQGNICHFDSQEFIDLLEVLTRYFDEEVELMYMYDTDTEGIRNEELLLDVFNIFPSEYIASDGEYDLVTFVGYPGGSGNGADFNINGRYGICAASQNIEGAWEFMTLLLSKRVQSSFSSLVYPVNQAALVEKMDKFVREFGQEYPDARQRADELLEYIAGVKTISYRENAIFDIINEEAPALFSGKKTAQETAKVIQNRVSTYLAEND